MAFASILYNIGLLVKPTQEGLLWISTPCVSSPLPFINAKHKISIKLVDLRLQEAACGCHQLQSSNGSGVRRM